MIETVAIVGLIAVGSAAAGVLIGRYYVPDDRHLRRAAKHGTLFLSALNRVLARDSKGAIADLRRVVEEDVSSLEPYYALAALFRRSGDWERAIRVHQAIQVREEKGARKIRAVFELGLDYRSAGMPKRAILALEDCLRLDPQHGGALRALAGLYEQQARYPEAAEALHRLEKSDEAGESSVRRAHLYAAAAEASLENHEFGDCERWLREATRIEKGDRHVAYVKLRLELARRESNSPRRAIGDLLDLQPELASVIAPMLVDAKATESGPEGARVSVSELLAAIAKPHPSPAAIWVAAAECIAEKNPSRARTYLSRALESDPAHALALFRDAELAQASDSDSERVAALSRLLEGESLLSDDLLTRWRCDHCGLHRSVFTWRCSGCRHWGTLVVAQIGAGDSNPARERRQYGRPGSGAPGIASDGSRLSSPAAHSSIGRFASWARGRIKGTRRGGESSE